jgi:multidrug efflux system outer membrane protein
MSSRILVLALAWAPVLAWASGASVPKESPAEKPDLSDIHLNPETLKGYVLDLTSNQDMLQALNDLYRSKLNYSYARSRLYPSLNLAALAGSIANPSFLISSVTTLLPFLVPSVWFDKASAKKQFQADQVAFRILQRDTLASALSLYLAIQRDERMLHQFQQDLEDLKRLERAIEIRHDFGAASDAELKLTRSARIQAELRVLDTEKYLIDQKGELSRAISVDPRREIILEDFEMGPVNGEDWSYEKLLDLVWTRMGARLQLRLIAQSRDYETWSRRFAFFGESSLSAHVMEGDRLPRYSTKNLSINADFTISYSHAVAVQLANNNEKAITLMTNELYEETEVTVRRFVANLRRLLLRKELAAENMSIVLDNFHDQLEKYNLGAGATFQDVINSRLGMQDAAVKLIDTSRDVDLARIVLSRWQSAGLFENVPAPNFSGPKAPEPEHGYY